MGRFYHGAINGKFWFGIQDSDDIGNLVSVDPTNEYMWKVCSCDRDATNEDEYCTSCYESKVEHEEAVIDDEGEIHDDVLYMEESTVTYYLNREEHYDELKRNMDELKSKIDPRVIDEFDKIEQNENILDTFSGVFNNAANKLVEIRKEFEMNSNVSNQQEVATVFGVKKYVVMNELVARYTIGYQLEYCLRATDEDCYVNCEC